MKHITEASDAEIAATLTFYATGSGLKKFRAEFDFSPQQRRNYVPGDYVDNEAYEHGFDDGVASVSPPQPTPSDEKLLADLRYVADGLRRTMPYSGHAEVVAKAVAALSTPKGN